MKRIDNDGTTVTHTGFNLYLGIFTIFVTFAAVTITGCIQLGPKALFLVFPITISFIPTGFFLYIWYWRKSRGFLSCDRVSKFFLFGIIGVVPIVGIELLVSLLFDDTVEKDVEAKVTLTFWDFILSFFSAFLVASFWEELLKLSFAFLVTVDHNTDAPATVMVLTLAGTLGMATIETVGYVFTTAIIDGVEDSIFISILRSLLAITLHASTGTLIGSHIARRKFQIEKKNLLKVMAIPLLSHGLYDFLTMFGTDLANQNNNILWILPFITGVVVLDLILLLFANWQVKQLNKIFDNPYNAISQIDDISSTQL